MKRVIKNIANRGSNFVIRVVKYFYNICVISVKGIANLPSMLVKACSTLYLAVTHPELLVVIGGIALYPLVMGGYALEGFQVTANIFFGAGATAAILAALITRGYLHFNIVDFFDRSMARLADFSTTISRFLFLQFPLIIAVLSFVDSRLPYQLEASMLASRNLRSMIAQMSGGLAMFIISKHLLDKVIMPFTDGVITLVGKVCKAIDAAYESRWTKKLLVVCGLATLSSVVMVTLHIVNDTRHAEKIESFIQLLPGFMKDVVTTVRDALKFENIELMAKSFTDIIQQKSIHMMERCMEKDFLNYALPLGCFLSSGFLIKVAEQSRQSPATPPRNGHGEAGGRFQREDGHFQNLLEGNTPVNNMAL